MTDYDRSHDDIDPGTGALTAEAVAKRQGIMARLGVSTWFEAVNHALFRSAANGDEELTEAPATEVEAETATEHVDEPEVPGSAQDASAEAFSATVEGEAAADEQPGAG